AGPAVALRSMPTSALGDGADTRRPLPEVERVARRLIALDRNCLRRLAESAVGQPVDGLLHVPYRGVVRLLEDDEAPLLLSDLPLLGRGGAAGHRPPLWRQ